jgi:hypothetical protein
VAGLVSVIAILLNSMRLFSKFNNGLVASVVDVKENSALKELVISEILLVISSTITFS